MSTSQTEHKETETNKHEGSGLIEQRDQVIYHVRDLTFKRDLLYIRDLDLPNTRDLAPQHIRDLVPSHVRVLVLLHKRIWCHNTQGSGEGISEGSCLTGFLPVVFFLWRGEGFKSHLSRADLFLLHYNETHCAVYTWYPMSRSIHSLKKICSNKERTMWVLL